jgi:NAD(P)-dependent dehydrogenase (short-subunit alcohol dehydrogenase family)
MQRGMRRIVVSGANKGIGLALVSAILEHAEDTYVYLGSRDAGRGEAARAALVAAHPGWASRIEVLPLDVADDHSVERARAQLEARLGGERLYGVVNNAGVGNAIKSLASMLGVNTHGVRRVCEALGSLVAAGGRVVNVTSASGPTFVAKCSDERKQVLTNPDVGWSQIEAVLDEALAIAARGGSFAEAGLGDGEPYGFSKACANAFTLAFARTHPHLHVNACTPGFIETDLTRPYVDGSGRTAQELGMKPPTEGTRAPMHLLFGALEGNGRYYGSDARRSPLDRYRSPADPEYIGL